MKISLNEFREQLVGETIWLRGLSYYQGGAVEEFEKISPNEYRAIVVGSEFYKVRIKSDGDMVESWNCNCPYDLRSVCKHVVATLLHFQEITDPSFDKQKNPSEKKGKKTKTEQVDEILNQLSFDDLKEFITKKTKQDRAFRDLFLASFTHYNILDGKKIYRSKIKLLIQSLTDRDRFLDWEAVSELKDEIIEMITDAKEKLKSGDFMNAFYLCTAVMEEMMKVLDDSDDSNGDIGGCVDSACELLCDMAAGKLPEEIRKMIFNYALTAFGKKSFSERGWHLNMLELSFLLSKQEEDFDNLMSLIDQTELSEYSQESMEKISYDLILKFRGEKEAGIYLEKNIANSNLRTIALERALEKKEFDRVKKIAWDGIKYDEKDRPGLAIDWYQYLLKAAQRTKNKEKIIEHARYLFIDGFSEEENYYAILKRHIDATNWVAFVNQLIVDLTNKRGQDSESISEIYIIEKWWEELLEWVKTNASLESLSRYEKYLKKDYAPELIKMYAAGTIKYLANNMSREHYQKAGGYIKRIADLGDRDTAYQLIEQFKNNYPKRKAMIEELEAVQNKTNLTDENYYNKVRL